MTGVAFPQAFLIRLLRDLIDKQTWMDEGSISERMLRSQLLLLACVRQYQPCVQKAEGYFRQWQEADGNLRSVFIEQLACSSEKATAPHSSTLAWKIPWAEEPGGLQSMGSQGVGRDWATSLSLFTFMHWRRKWQPTSVSLPGESQGRGSLAGCSPWGRTESDTTGATQQQQQLVHVRGVFSVFPHHGSMLGAKKKYRSDCSGTFGGK